MSILPLTPWCNGSTTGFGPVSLSSNLGGVAILDEAPNSICVFHMACNKIQILF